MILHVLTEVAKVVGHPLQLAAVVIDTQITPYEELKQGVEVEGTSLVVAEELLLKGNPELLSSVVACASALLEVNGDGAKNPRQDHVVHPTLVGVIEGRSIGGDVVIECVALEHQRHKVAPMRVLSGHDAKDDGH
jgi:hypothetical protein